ncbi:uncharacterized protein YbaA (DUF1428 family) [Palleronia aestuarii]|uniref:Uncharacterized protein YbaA (DUF1428 family) n=1 Tax=Palleronia aestuarii TaxID=568105 RepID=A0A2W7N496_9RHOB|nr:DUF1428 domain-containing protein [Palleronia aestuarii]PZX14908.1 uncharacterized protein YbaA (DUF1428 family) [Palleronia aestuarii]
MSYVAGFLTPVPNDRKEEYIESARKSWPIFKDYGALHHMEAWGDEVPDGTRTDFKRAVDLKPDETVCFAWIIWPDKEAYDRCGASMQSDPRWQDMDMPFDGKRMMWGGFAPIFEEKA